MKDWVVPLAKAQSAPLPPGRLSAELGRHGSMTLRFYRPPAVDPQSPHDQDEIYIIQSGSGAVLSGLTEEQLQRRPVAAGDAVFVPAGSVHRFVDHSPDFAAWVIFWGPIGGEAQ